MEKDGACHSLTIMNGCAEDIAQYTCTVENVRMQTNLELRGADDVIEVNEENLKAEIIATKGQDVVFNIPFKKTALQKPNSSWTLNGESKSSDKVTCRHCLF